MLTFVQGKVAGSHTGGTGEQLHIIFLDKRRSRAWLSPAAIQPWAATTATQPTNLSAHQSRKLAAAEIKAASLANLPQQDRLNYCVICSE